MSGYHGQSDPHGRWQSRLVNEYDSSTDDELQQRARECRLLGLVFCNEENTNMASSDSPTYCCPYCFSTDLERSNKSLFKGRLQCNTCRKLLGGQGTMLSTLAYLIVCLILILACIRLYTQSVFWDAAADALSRDLKGFLGFVAFPALGTVLGLIAIFLIVRDKCRKKPRAIVSTHAPSGTKSPHTMTVGEGKAIRNGSELYQTAGMKGAGLLKRIKIISLVLIVLGLAAAGIAICVAEQLGTTLRGKPLELLVEVVGSVGMCCVVCGIYLFTVSFFLLADNALLEIVEQRKECVAGSVGIHIALLAGIVEENRLLTNWSNILAGTFVLGIVWFGLACFLFGFRLFCHGKLETFSPGIVCWATVLYVLFIWSGLASCVLSCLFLHPDLGIGWAIAVALFDILVTILFVRYLEGYLASFGISDERLLSRQIGKDILLFALICAVFCLLLGVLVLLIDYNNRGFGYLLLAITPVSCLNGVFFHFVYLPVVNRVARKWMH